MKKKYTQFMLKDIVAMAAVGRLTPDRARIWVRLNAATDYRIEVVNEADPSNRLSLPFRITVGDAARNNTRVLELPPSGSPFELLPLNTYRYDLFELTSTRSLVRGRFEMPPTRSVDQPRCSFGVVSCHQPFTQMGTLRSASMEMLARVPDTLRREGVRFVLAGGDQVYSDAPAGLSVKDDEYLEALHGLTKSYEQLTAAEARRVLHRRYRSFWGERRIQQVYADFPTYPAMDDHELLDDWGTDGAHAALGDYRRGALDAFHDYQTSRVMDRPADDATFHFDFVHGPVAGFVFDIRSQRKWNGAIRPTEIFGRTQLADLESFLDEHRSHPVLALVISVPLVHLTEFIAGFGAVEKLGLGVDLRDHWSFKTNRAARDRLIGMLLAHHRRNPTQQIVLVGGDVHIGTVFRIDWGDGIVWHQITSSAVTNTDHERLRRFLRRIPRVVRKIETGADRAAVSLTRDTSGGRSGNPTGSLNVGTVEVDATMSPAHLRLKLHAVRKVGDAKQLVPIYDSGPI